MIYLDYAATTHKKPKVVYDTLYDYTVNHGANALRGNYVQSLRASNVIVDAQDSVAGLFNFKYPQYGKLKCITLYKDNWYEWNELKTLKKKRAV